MDADARGRKRRTSGLLPFVALAGIVGSHAAPGPAVADSIYRYIDDRGVVHFSDVPTDARFNRVERVRQHGPVISPRPSPRIPSERDYDRLIVAIAARHRVRPGLVKAVIAAESNFRPDAVSRVGAQGLMQLMPSTAESLGVERPFGVIENMDGGVRYLRAMLDRYGDLTRALAAYNAGPAAVDRHGGIPPYRETQAYVKRVLEYYRGYRNEFERARRTGRNGPRDQPRADAPRRDGGDRAGRRGQEGRERRNRKREKKKREQERGREAALADSGRGIPPAGKRARRPLPEAPRAEALALAEERLRAAGLLREP
ncbi:MAG TPA: DUF4124 domain-containing protein [Deltaproteobacteria bacterium]|nr:DUF4124 domain-containing protein [Deltaproteobacteria bacterium]